MTSPPQVRKDLTRYAWLSVAAALATMALKVVAYWLTGSVGLLSDALESIVNLVGGLMALAMLTIAARPPDADHPHGHSKAEYFSSGVEGTLILVAAISIGVAAVERWMHPKALEEVGIGLIVSAGASLINLGVALLLLKVGKEHDSITLRSNGTHLMTDVWTSVGVLVGVGAVVLTGWNRLDPLVALAVAANIVWSGVHIIRDSVSGLMDTAIPMEEQEQLRAILETHVCENVQYHALWTRQAGSRRFVSFHVLVPGAWTVHEGHALLDRIEADIGRAMPNITVFTHLESLEDPSSWDDIVLEQSAAPSSPTPPRGVAPKGQP